MHDNSGGSLSSRVANQWCSFSPAAWVKIADQPSFRVNRNFVFPQVFRRCSSQACSTRSTPIIVVEALRPTKRVISKRNGRSGYKGILSDNGRKKSQGLVGSAPWHPGRFHRKDSTGSRAVLQGLLCARNGLGTHLYQHDPTMIHS